MNSKWTLLGRVGVLLVLSLVLVSCGGDEEPAGESTNPADQIGAAVEQMGEDQPSSTSERQPVPEMEQKCSDVTDQQIADYARDYERAMSEGGLPVITGSEQKVHDCWRYQLWLDGEIGDYGSGTPVL